MGRKKKEQTFIKSIRVDLDTKEFLENLDNANFFVIQLLKDTNEFKRFLKIKESQRNQKNLFDL